MRKMYFKSKYVILFIYLTIIMLSANAQSTNNRKTYQENIEWSIASITAKLNKFLLANGKPGENVLFSPINIYAALALVHLAATGQTRNEISTLMSLPNNDEQMLYAHQDFKRLLVALQKPGKANVTLADGIFAQETFQFKGQYIKNIKGLYNSDAKPVDFKTKAAETTKKVNQWISEKTFGRIPTLFSHPLPQDTLMLIASCLYFSSSWATQFIEFSTTMEKFNTGSKEVQVHMMNNKQSLGYSNNVELQYEAINLPYSGKEFSMYIVLPYETSSVADLAHKLQAEHFRDIVRETSAAAAAANFEVDYKIPRMKFKWSKSVNQELKQLGVEKLFDSPQLQNMTNNVELKISEITHAAEIEVHEKGTVATAATALSFIPLSLPYPPAQQPVKFYVNRPFIFFIYHSNTKAIIMSALVYKPTENIR